MPSHTPGHGGRSPDADVVLSLKHAELPARPRAVLESLLGVASTVLEGGVTQTLNEFEQQLFKMAEQARSNDQQNRCFEALREVRRVRADVAPRFLIRLETALANLGAQVETAREFERLPKAGREEFALVDPQELEQSLAMQEVASKAEIRHSQALFALGQRFGVLAGSAALGLVFVGLLHGAGLLAREGFPVSSLRFWIGDSVGILVTVPMLLAATLAVLAAFFAWKAWRLMTTPNVRVGAFVLRRGGRMRLAGCGYATFVAAIVLLVGQSAAVRGVILAAAAREEAVTTPFDSAKFGFYLVTRLDGYTVDDAKRLVDRALAARAETGPFLLDAHTSRSPGYKQANEAIQSAGAMLRARHARVMLDTTDAFQTPTTPLAGYVSWGSNDANYSEKGYRGLKFKPGALAETFVSTSARTFSKVKSGQSLIADLVAGGVTGVKGYVAEPTTRALANPAILFERYLDGHNLAESFAMASPLVRWKDVVVGDPLCRPHDRTR